MNKRIGSPGHEGEGESPQNGDSLSVGEGNYWKGQEDIQNTIDSYNTECRKILHQKYIFETKQDGYYLTKKYEHQNEITPWSGEDVGLVYELFKDTRITYKQREDLSSLDGSEEFTQKDNPTGEIKDERFAIEPEPRTWHIERPLMYDGDYLTVSEDGIQNRPWKREEIEKIKKIFS